MKKIVFGIFVSLFVNQSIVAKESPLCEIPYNNVERKVKIINEKKSDLSKMALKKLYSDLIIDVENCISYCEGKKFDLCNNASKEIEK
ncbi:hypothetical protein L5F37_03915 [Aliarcobacter butzleri]|uniref:hypothetical protein n=1 Tax=Aliarcobacter butzleri TaxID=28197 RepID=UPI001EDA6C4F|nr:hypothetical protein [Aliarcobacter butzleri]MCG3662541.1 hypothetical protein [Aliarcobacter butzleri]